jgi:adenine-specific DNA-methyltransferase
MNKPEPIKPEKMPLTSMDFAKEKRDELKRCLGQAFPEVFAEGSVDFDELKRVLGEWVDPGKERFGLNWPGKAECMKIIQQPSIATIKPDRGESVNFDETENLFIEGDNLEVLKLLQKAYFGRIKMIYIDPPYNTGNEFIYPDKYAETLETYLAYTGQIDAEGRKFSSNTELAGRYHSRWLNMMYPRLYLARNLLKDDGVMFVSCDDHEVHNLRAVLNEVFGEENFVATVIWQKVYSPKNSARHFSEDHDYIVVYARHAEDWRPKLLPRTEEMEARYDNPDNDPRGPWKPGDLSARNYYSEGTYPITCPSGRVIEGPPPGNYWRVSKEKFLEMDRDNRIWWGQNGNNIPAIKRFLSEVKQGRVPQTFWPYEEVGHTQDAKKQLMEHVRFEHTDNVLDTVKPTGLIRRMLQLATEPRSGDLVLDFFAGSGTTAHGVLQQNREDAGTRRFILVQLPEPLPKPESQLRTIADIAKSRIRSVVAEFNREDADELDINGNGKLDMGFKTLKLARSNFRVWNGETVGNELERQIEMHIDHLSEASSAEEVLYELLLKAGFPLTTKVQTVKLVGKQVFSIENGALLICLEKEITSELIDALAEANPLQVICLDEGFKGNDQLKANAVQTFKARAQAEESEIVFKTV